MPDPAMMPPSRYKRSLFAKASINASISANAAKITEAEMLFDLNIPSATSCPIAVQQIKNEIIETAKTAASHFDPSCSAALFLSSCILLNFLKDFI